jgi:hypothetical protein
MKIIFNAEARRTRRFAESKDFGLRWQSAVATPLSDSKEHGKSGVALRFPPHAKKFLRGPLSSLCLCVKVFGYLVTARLQSIHPYLAMV